MKALSIQQPWAHAILHSGKDIENRTWRTSYRGPLLIHAGKRYDFDDGHLILRAMGVEHPNRKRAELGGIVGIAVLTDIITESDSKWFGGPYGWVLGHAQAVPFVPLRGHLGLFDVDVYGLPVWTAAEIDRWVMEVEL